jgi:RHS repeat-associated protein
MTDSIGAVAETLDYFPYGSMRLDIKAGSFNEQRKYIGQEFDNATGLNYLNARYYHSTIGRFISQDPMFWGLPAELLADPQQQNSYSYARNNPITMSDPSGLVVLTLSGTDLTGSGKSNYLKNNTTLQNNIKAEFKGQDIYNYTWSGKDNDAARQQAAKDFSSYVTGIMNSLPDNEPLNIACHSHGCNVAALYTQQFDSHQINNLISFGQPILGAYSNNESKIDNHINVYSYRDQVQNHAGNQIKFSGVAGFGFGLMLCGVPCAALGAVMGNSLGWGEFGLAGRTVDGANNQNATTNTRKLWGNHGELLNQSIWDNRVHSKIKQ